MRKLGIACVLAGISLIAGSVFLHLRTGSLGATPEAVLELERALARPGLLALATLDVRALVDLDVLPEAAEDDDDGYAARLAQAGVDLRRDVSHATVALTAHEDGEARTALALFGRFDPAAVEGLLREREDVSIRGGGGGEVLLFERTDPETCEVSGPFAAHLAPERILVTHAEEIDALLAGPGASDGSGDALRDLTRFQHFRSGQLVSGAVFVPDELPETENLFVAMAAQGAAAQVDGFRAFYAGAAPRILPPGLDVDALFEGTDADATTQKAAAWQSAIETGREGLAEKLPTLAVILQALEVRAEGTDLTAELRLGSEEIERLRELPGELGSSLFGGSIRMTATSEDAQQEQLDDSPLAFVPVASSAKLRGYDPRQPFASPVDATSGPLGVRLAALRLGEQGGAELDIEAFATGLPNLGDRGERAELRVTQVLGRGGEDLLAVESCGSDRNDKPAPLMAGFGAVRTGTKKVRLRADAAPGDVESITGVARIRLPVRTESVRLPARAGQVAERAGARLEISAAEGGSFSYAVSGDDAALLHLRGLNQAGKPLAGRGSSSMGAFFGSGDSGSKQYAGSVSEIEAIFALEEELLELPFQLSEGRPGTDGESLAPKRDDAARPELTALAHALEKGLERVAGRLASELERVVDGSSAPLARQQAGPFLVSLEGIWSFGGLMPRLEVSAPEIPGLSEQPNALELRLAELRMADGTVHEGDWLAPLSLGRGFGGEKGLVGSAQIETGAPGSGDDVASLRGALTIRLPERVGVLRFGSAELGAEATAPGLSVRISELGRDRFTLRADTGGERLLGAVAYNGFGDELWVPHVNVERAEDGAVLLKLDVRGVPERIEVRYAEKLAQAEYPFTLVKDQREVALRP